jgi:hypothetical protein
LTQSTCNDVEAQREQRWELKTLSAIPVFGVKLMRVMKGQNGMD